MAGKKKAGEAAGKIAADLEILKDSYNRQVKALLKFREFIGYFYSQIHADIQDFLEEKCLDREKEKSKLEKYALLIQAYLREIGIEISIDDKENPAHSLFRLRGAYDNWYIEKFDSIREGFERIWRKIALEK